MPVTAHRPAPLQVSWLGFPGTSGAAPMDYVDYFIGDPVTTPLDRRAPLRRKLAQMPLCYQPNDAKRCAARADAAPTGRAGQTRCCGLPPVIARSRPRCSTAGAASCAVPDATLWLLRWNTNVQAVLEAAARERSIDPRGSHSCRYCRWSSISSRTACADLTSIAWPCNAHTTAGEAL